MSIIQSKSKTLPTGKWLSAERQRLSMTVGQLAAEVRSDLALYESGFVKPAQSQNSAAKPEPRRGS
jgi:hypothetical protein